MVLKDYRGTVITPGSIVVFNKSGQLKMGIVLGFKQSKTNKKYFEG